MAISSPGIGSGLDVKSIVSQLVELEKKPLTKLQATASSLQSQVSAFGQLKSQIANLQDQVEKLASPTQWQGMTLTSNNSSAVSGTTTSSATATQLSVEVSQLAAGQTTATASIPTGATFGGGTLSLQLGEWNNSTFNSSSTTVTINVEAGDDLTSIANKVNASEAGLTATIMRDGTGERLLLRSNATGVEMGFRVQAADLTGTAITDGTGLGQLAYDPENNALGAELKQAAQNTLATINGISVSSSNNELEEAVAGVNLKFLQVTNGPVDVTISRETVSIRNNINNLVESYNALSKALQEMTKYNPNDQTAGTLQGDATALGLQTALRRILGGMGPSGNAFSGLSDVGVEFQLDGTLKVNTDKLDNAVQNPEQLEAFFTFDGGSNAANGLGTRLAAFTSGLLDSDGPLTTKAGALQKAIDRNTKDQDRLNDRLERTEARLLAQYSRLDTTLAKLTALNNYVAQQVTTWNQSNDS